MYVCMYISEVSDKQGLIKLKLNQSNMPCTPGKINKAVGSGVPTISDVHPDIIQTHILTCLDGPTLASAATTCSQLNTLSAHHHLWDKICHSTWPSTNTPRVRHVIHTFPNSSRSFFSDSFPTAVPTTVTLHRTANPPELIISAVDLFHGQRLILSKVVETETESGWFRCSPFRVDLLDPKDSVETGMEYQHSCEEEEEELKLSWIVIDQRGKRAVNVSSGKPVSVQRHWLTGEVQVRFATVLKGGERGSATEVVLCSLMVTLGEEMKVREVCFQMEDMDGIVLNGRDSLGILQRALEGGRKKLGEEEKERYMEFVNRKIERKEKKLKAERRLDILCVVLVPLFFAALSTLFLF